MAGGLRDLDLGSVIVPARLLAQRFARSGGKGGQNVNKVETKVELRLDLDRAASVLGAARTARIRTKCARRIDAEGWLRVTCEEHRERGRNLAAAIARMERILAEAMVEPRLRRATRPTRASKERRLTAKQHRSSVKQSRSRDID